VQPWVPVPPPCADMNPRDSNRTASSAHGNSQPGHGLHRGMLDSAQSWSATQSNHKQWYQIDLGGEQWIGGVVTQGRHDADQWVTKYQIWLRNTGDWWCVGGQHVAKTYDGNTNRDSRVEHKFSKAQRAQFVRIYPQEWHNHISMRVGLSDCNFPAPPPPPPVPPPAPPAPITAANVSFTFDTAGKYDLCYKLADGNNYTKINKDPLVVAPVYPTHWVTEKKVVVTHEPTLITLTGGFGLNLRNRTSGGDMVKLAFNGTECSDPPKPGLVSTDLGPADSISSTMAITQPMVFRKEGYYKICYKAGDGEFKQVTNKSLLVSNLMEIDCCMSVGNVNIDQMATPAVRAAFKASILSAMGNVSNAATVKPGKTCEGEEDLGGTVADKATSSAMSFIVKDVPKVSSSGAVAGLKTSANSGALLTQVAQKAAQAGVTLPTPALLGLSVVVRVQPPKAAEGFHAFTPAPKPALSFAPVAGEQNSANPNMQNASIPKGVYPNVRGVYDAKTGAWLPKREEVDVADFTDLSELVEFVDLSPDKTKSKLSDTDATIKRARQESAMHIAKMHRTAAKLRTAIQGLLVEKSKMDAAASPKASEKKSKHALRQRKAKEKMQDASNKLRVAKLKWAAAVTNQKASVLKCKTLKKEPKVTHAQSLKCKSQTAAASAKTESLASEVKAAKMEHTKAQTEYDAVSEISNPLVHSTVMTRTDMTQHI